MPLLLVFLVLTVGLFSFFWGGSLIAQAYFYQQPASRLSIRAVIAAFVVSAYLCLWVFIDKRSPGRYDTFFEFSPYSTSTFNEFEAIRWQSDPLAQMKGKVDFLRDEKGKPIGKATKYKRQPGGGKSPTFIEEGTNTPFRRNDTNTMTAEIILKPDGVTPVTFKADLNTDKNGRPVYSAEGRFNEENGSRYFRSDQLGVLYIPSTGTVVGALMLNLFLFIVWIVSLWLILRFSFWHAVMLGGISGVVTMLIAMPLLFRPNREPARQLDQQVEGIKIPTRDVVSA